jgi:hypothetical protein
VALGGVTGLVVSFLLLPSSFDHEVDMGGVVIVERTRSVPVISTCYFNMNPPLASSAVNNRGSARRTSRRKEFQRTALSAP